ncbi:GntP family permease [Pseudoclavibacter sp. RFBJ3]|uniref:GntP family permease n=1 Tax=Pseudoclavibacter TaxID=255204 RepID=UPI000838150C|nr:MULTISPECIES: GntP family permease [Pseudoclavibacter]PPF83859.1 GntP family permease [Pseudoclavibacter sp. RFBJ5]PPF92139.1 GntP family permease [Pseudoclavibacter sp. RFBJ3]PPF97002.1 GntP family permease [Pseudoclavibacter sp. RFBH5]PPG23689.1 GntP family permease [Pseudoclavibacter sp. RFBI4]
MEEEWTQTLGTAPLLGIAAGAIALILILIIRFRLHAFLTLVIVSLLTALVAGVPVSAVASTLTGGFGSTLATVALLIGFGAMLGRLIEHSGGAKALADKLVDVFGEKRAPFALGIASLILGFPMFFDAGLIMMLPIVFAVARRVSGNNVLLFGIPAAAAFSVMHVFLPPHPGPVAATELYEANLGVVLLLGLIIVFPLWYVSGYLWGKFVAKRIQLPVPALFGDLDEDQPKNPPKVSTIILLLLLPMVLIFLNTGISALASAGVVDGDAIWAQAAVLLGNSPIALLIAVVTASIVLGTRRGENGTALEKLLDSSLGPICSVILITGAGGMFGGVLRASGIGDALADTLGDLGLPLIVAAYVIAVVLRVAQGSATVALVTAAGLIAPAVVVADLNDFQVASIVLATAAGSVFAGHVNDSGFWLVGRLMGMDVKTTLKTWTVQQTIESVTAFAFVLVVYLVASLF